MCTNFEKSAFEVLDAFSGPVTLADAISRLCKQPLHLGGGNTLKTFIDGLIIERYLVKADEEHYRLSEKGISKKRSLSQVVRAA